MNATYNNQCANEHVGRIMLSSHDLIDEIGNQPDNGNERDELSASQCRESDTQRAQLRSLETHPERDGLVELCDERQTRSRVGRVQDRTQGQTLPWVREDGQGRTWSRNLGGSLG
jgi:hypothetical protein